MKCVPLLDTTLNLSGVTDVQCNARTCSTNDSYGSLDRIQLPLRILQSDMGALHAHCATTLLSKHN